MQKHALCFSSFWSRMFQQAMCSRKVVGKFKMSLIWGSYVYSRVFKRTVFIQLKTREIENKQNILLIFCTFGIKIGYFSHVKSTMSCFYDVKYVSKRKEACYC